MPTSGRIDLDLAGKAVIITGGGTGMGREMTLEFASRGADVVVSSNVESHLPALEADADGLPGRVTPVAADVRSERDFSKLVDTALTGFGRLDALVNNAGISSGESGSAGDPLSSITMDDWNLVIDVNLGGTVRGIKAVIPVMSEAGGGSIINLSSGTVRSPLPGLAPYTTSKFAIEGLTQIAALELQSQGIRVNTLQPGGPVNTGILRSDLPPDMRAKVHQPTIIRKCAAWLVSDESSMLSGQSFVAFEWNRQRGIVDCPCPRCESRDLTPGRPGWSSSTT